MLTLASIRPALPVHLERDDYIPLRLEADAPPCDCGYSFIYDLDGQGLAEFVIAQETGRFYRCVIVSMPRNISEDLDSILSLPSQNGLPNFLIDPSDDISARHTRDVRNTMFAHETHDALFLRWSEFEPNQRIDCGAASFLFHDNQLVGFGATGWATS